MCCTDLAAWTTPPTLTKSGVRRCKKERSGEGEKTKWRGHYEKGKARIPSVGKEEDSQRAIHAWTHEKKNVSSFLKEAKGEGEVQKGEECTKLQVRADIHVPGVVNDREPPLTLDLSKKRENKSCGGAAGEGVRGSLRRPEGALHRRCLFLEEGSMTEGKKTSP